MAGGSVAHFVYSTVLGVVFVAGSGVLHGDGIFKLTGYWINGVLLFLIAGSIIMPLAGVTKEMRKMMPKSQMAGILVLHVVYGLILAASVAFIPLG